MTIVALLLAAAALAVSSGSLWYVRERFDRVDTAPASTYDDSQLRDIVGSHQAHLEELTDAVADLEKTARDQTLAIDEGIKHVDRAERRVRAAVGRARKRMEDLGYVDDSLEAEAEGLREFHGNGSQGEGVQPLREGMAGAPAGDSGPDMSAFPGRW